MNWVTLLLELSTICSIKPADIESHIRVESNYCKYVSNKSSSARGCLQVLKGNLNVFQLYDMRNKIRSIQIGVDYMCRLKKSFPNTWRGRYFVGNGKLEGVLLEQYNTYVNKLDHKYNKYFKGYKNEKVVTD